jgi:MFS family permease
MTETISPARAPGQGMQRRVLLSSFLGGTLEYFDFYLYATASAVVFSPLFFPKFDPLVGVIASFSVLALGWFMRPLGGIIAGHFGDVIGRKRILMISFTGMGVSSTLVGFLPTYDQLGVWAAVLLVALRLFQGLFAGAEVGGALLMAVEHAPANQRARYGSVVQLAVFAGILLANGSFFSLTSLLSEEALLSWGWRIPFLASVVLIIFTWVVRSRIDESPIFEAEKQKKSETQHNTPRAKYPLLRLIKNDPRTALISLTLMLAPSCLGAIFGTVIAAYALQIGYSRTTTLAFASISNVVALGAVYFWCVLSDKIGRRPVVLTGVIAGTLLVFLLFPLFDTMILPLALLGLVLLAFFYPAALGPMPTLLAEQFRTSERYSGVSFAYQITASIGTGLTPVLATSILFWAGGPPNTIGIMILVLGMNLVTILGLSLLRDNRHQELSEIGLDLPIHE